MAETAAAGAIRRPFRLNSALGNLTREFATIMPDSRMSIWLRRGLWGRASRPHSMRSFFAPISRGFQERGWVSS